MTFEAKKLDIEVEEYRRLYELHWKLPKLNAKHPKLSSLLFYFLSWTGFGEKKLWDFLQLLIVPAALGLGTYYLQDSAKQREQTVAEDKANQDTLVKYLDQMADLLQKNLRNTETSSETFIIAQAKTVIALQSLDPKRQHLVIQFLAAANLNTLDRKKGILYQAQMSKANLNKADLSGADLSYADLFNANLSHADLISANLSDVNLKGAKRLSKIQIDQAKLCKTTLPDGKVSDRDCEKLRREHEERIQILKQMKGFKKSSDGGVVR